MKRELIRRCRFARTRRSPSSKDGKLRSVLGGATRSAHELWIHTERVKKLPGPIEFVFNTPSYHRVHHGANELYLDRNYGGILIIWDRIFGTYQGETERSATA